VVALSLELYNYEDVASEAAAGTLLEYYRSNYVIEIEEGATISYGLLYNLSLRELEVL
jgi:hypothetical protein